MKFLDAVKICFSKYVTFSGRARRAEYWWWVLFTTVAGAVLAVIDTALFGFEQNYDPLNSIFSLATFLPSISVWVRRLHDVNRSGWWAWLILIPLIGWIILLYWAVKGGTEGPNRFGPDPITGEGGAEAYSPSAIPSVKRD
ncbi:DUF805 domain-containing protein [Celeribacter litoreus]|uniref:DUF805 domain-containing protein n=1 Tax=Celeribacter litoreus TaxID=2876714 RepID=UPI001CCEB898|nr:DUF805 domain-containing protein [Celeribacter litoreus]MCA0044300.1 DUF805 domain-containing protein [Celeribacter litoreus]